MIYGLMFIRIFLKYDTNFYNLYVDYMWKKKEYIIKKIKYTFGYKTWNLLQCEDMYITTNGISLKFQTNKNI